MRLGDIRARAAVELTFFYQCIDHGGDGDRQVERITGVYPTLGFVNCVISLENLSRPRDTSAFDESRVVAREYLCQVGSFRSNFR